MHQKYVCLVELLDSHEHEDMLVPDMEIFLVYICASRFKVNSIVAVPVFSQCYLHSIESKMV